MSYSYSYALNASNIVEIQYIFMQPANGPILCEATHTVVIESISF